MIVYRPCRNPDPPAVVEVWNECVVGRGGFPIRSAALLERWLFAKPYYQPADLQLAVDDESGRLVGLALSGFGPDDDGTCLDPRAGVVCAVLVRPAYRKRGIGRELLRRAEQALRDEGATDIRFGAQWPASPYLFGLYGGSNTPGVLASEADADGFLTKMGFVKAEAVGVFHRKLDAPLTLADTRFGHLRRRYEGQVLRAASVGSWWQECTWGTLEPVEIRMTDKLTGIPAARAVLWELEGFGWRWGFPSAGILDMQVRPDLRRQGLGKLLLTNVLRFLQDQFFAIAELQFPAGDAAGIALVSGLGFEPIDTGYVYRRPESNPASRPREGTEDAPGTGDIASGAGAPSVP